MFYVVVGRLRAGTEHQRHGLHSEFSDHLASNRPRLRIGGPLRDEAGVQTGVFYIAEAVSRDTVMAFIQASPYYRAGLYEEVHVEEMTLEIGNMG